MSKTVCPECDNQIEDQKKECPECGAVIKHEVKKALETLDMIDDNTFEIKDGDSNRLIDNIKELGSLEKEVEKQSFEDENEEEIEVVIYECPVCESEVSEDDKECPQCGAIFEE